MSEIVLASNNRKKIIELETLLEKYASKNVSVKTLREIGYTDEIIEDGDSFEENSLIKASVPAKLGYIGIADDSGLCVDYLDGRPGIYSARYSGEGANDERNCEKLLRELDGVPAECRGAEFVCTASLVLPENSSFIIPSEWRISEELSIKSGISPERAMVVRGICRGVILTEKHGCDGFGYDPLFYFPEFEKTFAEIPQDMKNSVSHRGHAMREFIEKLTKIVTR